jgi:RNA recognition motif-containing protein
LRKVFYNYRLFFHSRICKKRKWNTFAFMAKKLYVGGLPYSTTDADLKSHFESAGSVDSATIIIDKMSGRSKGFGFVEMSNDDEALKAIDMFNGKDFGGRNLTVNEARPMEARPPRTGGFGGGDRGGDRGGFSRGRREY